MASNFLKANLVPFLTMTFSTLFLVSFITGVSYSLDTFYFTDMKKGTVVSGISVSELPKEIAKEKIEAEIDNWKETTTVSFLYKNKEITISTSEFYFFDVDETLRDAKNNQTTSLQVFLNEDTVERTLLEFLSEEKFAQLDYELLLEDLKKYGRSLRNENLMVNVHHYLNEDEQVVAEVEIEDLLVNNHLIKAVHIFDGFIIAAKQEMSVVDHLRKNRIDTINDQVYSIVATAIYELSLQTNFKINERHISKVLPVYSQLGLEAKIDRASDLKIYNPNTTAYRLDFELSETSLRATISGIPFDHTYRIELSDPEITAYERTVKQDLSINGIQVEQKGHPGQEVSVYREHLAENGSLEEREWISNDVYDVVHSIEVHGRNVDENGASVKGY